MPPPQKRSPPKSLELATNSLRNNTISSSVDDIYYEVVTRFWHPDLTKINRLDAEARALRTVAEIKRETKEEEGTGGDMKRVIMVRFTSNPYANEVRGGEPVKDFGPWIPAEDFVKGDLLHGGGFFADERGAQFKWKSHKNRLQLLKLLTGPSTNGESDSSFPSSDEEKPLAIHHSHRRHFYFFRMSKRAQLEFEPDVDWKELDFDRLIVSYLLMERKRRDSSILRVYPRV